MAKANRTCKVCGKKYYFCPDCSASKANPQPKWHVNYCEENCKTIFDTIVHYNCESISKKDASDILSKCDLSNMKSFSSEMVKSINEILKKGNADEVSDKNIE